MQPSLALESQVEALEAVPHHALVEALVGLAVVPRPAEGGVGQGSLIEERGGEGQGLRGRRRREEGR